ncbi:hypothetical protein Hanom_Chr15g01359451 [Helianthus anomalus]
MRKDIKEDRERKKRRVRSHMERELTTHKRTLKQLPFRGGEFLTCVEGFCYS